MKELISIKPYAELAYKILNSGSNEFSSNKEIISSLFKKNEKQSRLDDVKKRLTIIDSYYSTQMNKRLYGIEDLSMSLAKYSDEELINEAGKFLNGIEENKIKTLFSECYGIDKRGESSKKAISLISKYLYFLTEFKFPIYDSLAINSYKLLQKNNYVSDRVGIKGGNYFEKIINLNIISEIHDYEKLDNLLWLLGKLEKGSFSLLINKEHYLEVLKIIEINQGVEKAKIKSQQIDFLIREGIRNEFKNLNIFTKSQKEFFDFAYGLIKK